MEYLQLNISVHILFCMYYDLGRTYVNLSCCIDSIWFGSQSSSLSASALPVQTETHDLLTAVFVCPDLQRGETARPAAPGPLWFLSRPRCRWSRARWSPFPSGFLVIIHTHASARRRWPSIRPKEPEPRPGGYPPFPIQS